MQLIRYIKDTGVCSPEKLLGNLNLFLADVVADGLAQLLGKLSGEEACGDLSVLRQIVYSDPFVYVSVNVFDAFGDGTGEAFIPVDKAHFACEIQHHVVVNILDF